MHRSHLRLWRKNSACRAHNITLLMPVPTAFKDSTSCSFPYKSQSRILELQLGTLGGSLTMDAGKITFSSDEKRSNSEDANPQAEKRTESSTGQRFIPPLQTLNSQDETPVSKRFLSLISPFITTLQESSVSNNQRAAREPNIKQLRCLRGIIIQRKKQSLQGF